MFHKDCQGCDCGKSPRFLTKSLAEVVEWARNFKEDHDLTNPKVAKESTVPIGTVNRFFAFKGDDVVDFKYDTVHRIVLGLLNLAPNDDFDCPKASPQNKAALDALQKLNEELTLQLREEKINNEDLQEDCSRYLAEISELKNEIHIRDKNYRDDKTEYITEQDKKIKYIKDQCTRLRKTAVIMTALLLAVLFGIIAFLVYDVTHPGIGWLRY